jgi:hypothetical protein
MLHDSRRDRFPTLVRFIAWLRTKPADEKYNWTDCVNCAAGQFFDASLDDAFSWFDENKAAFVNEGVCLNTLAMFARPWTFGALLELAEKKLEVLAQKELFADVG